MAVFDSLTTRCPWPGSYTTPLDSTPPIDYERRRITAQPEAIKTLARNLLAPDATRDDRRAFGAHLWGAYTGGHISFAPRPLSEWANDQEDEPKDVLEAAATGLSRPRWCGASTDGATRNRCARSGFSTTRTRPSLDPEHC